MPEKRPINSERLGALPTLNHFLGRLHLPRHFARPLPTTEAALPFGKVLGVFLRNLILDSGPVYGTERWVIPLSPYLLDLAPEEVRLLNDDRGGRAPDALFDADHASLLSAVVVEATREFRLDLSELHNDSTSVTFSGAYPDAHGGLQRGRLTVAMSRSAHTEEHRPDVKQLVWILTGTPDFLYVADCKLATSAAMTYIHEQKGRVLTVLPETRKEEEAFRAWLQGHAPAWQNVPLTREERAQGETLPQKRPVEAPERSREGFPIVWVWSYEKERRAQAARGRR
ncbi:MAG: hypothetical protein JRN54_08475 [Nitrososphaerota archaeon]|nr:hypothetical protein [Nitrososphaerota archaeon]